MKRGIEPSNLGNDSLIGVIYAY